MVIFRDPPRRDWRGSVPEPKEQDRHRDGLELDETAQVWWTKKVLAQAGPKTTLDFTAVSPAPAPAAEGKE